MCWWWGADGGSTISALLAEQGWNVHILEKRSHPRFRIGESLLPQSLPVETIGSFGKSNESAQYGAEMISTATIADVLFPKH
jgi:hypothetical protein